MKLTVEDFWRDDSPAEWRTAHAFDILCRICRVLGHGWTSPQSMPIWDYRGHRVLTWESWFAIAHEMADPEGLHPEHMSCLEKPWQGKVRTSVFTFDVSEGVLILRNTEGETAAEGYAIDIRITVEPDSLATKAEVRSWDQGLMMTLLRASIGMGDSFRESALDAYLRVLEVRELANIEELKNLLASMKQQWPEVVGKESSWT